MEGNRKTAFNLCSKKAIFCNNYCIFGLNSYFCCMRKGERILRRVFPERSEFTEAEVDLAERIMEADREPSPRKSMLPTKFCPIGEEIEYGGHKYRCELRPSVSAPSEACSGCDFSRKYRNCSDVQCSLFDRRDRKFVWYKEVK